MQSIETSKAPSIIKLGASFIYESLVVIAISLAATAIFIFVFGDATQGYKRYALLGFLWVVLGAYFVWCWRRSGQTLAMQTWHLKLKLQVHQGYSTLIARYALATLSLAFFGLGFLWVLTNAKHQYLHDQLLAINIVDLTKLG